MIASILMFLLQRRWRINHQSFMKILSRHPLYRLRCWDAYRSAWWEQNVCWKFFAEINKGIFFFLILRSFSLLIRQFFFLTFTVLYCVPCRKKNVWAGKWWKIWWGDKIFPVKKIPRYFITRQSFSPQSFFWFLGKSDEFEILVGEVTKISPR